MNTIQDVLRDLMQELKTRKAPKDDLETLLRRALSKKELGHVKFRYFRKGTLGITVDSSVRMYQLNLHKEALLTKLNKKSHSVQEVRFYIGETK